MIVITPPARSARFIPITLAASAERADEATGERKRHIEAVNP